jgi:sphingomyelin phosphodiesterase
MPNVSIIFKSKICTTLQNMMKQSYLLLFLLFSFVAVNANDSLTVADSPQKIETEDNLKVLSWNIYMLPKIVMMFGKRDRSRAIVEVLKTADYDVIVFQEAFLPAAREIIGEGLKEVFPYNYGPANADKPGLKTNSGVWVISKIPLQVLGTIEYSDCAGVDCYARKGAMLLSGVWNEKEFQILGTHLQSEAHHEVRVKQLDQIFIELLAKYRKEDVPQVICGDMNTEIEIKANYCVMLECLDAEDGETEGIEQSTYNGYTNRLAESVWKKDKTTLDYVLLRKNGAKAKIVKRNVNVLTKAWKRGRKDLSDHYGVLCEVKF